LTINKCLQLAADEKDSRIEESEPKKLFTTMPVIYVTAINMKDLKARAFGLPDFQIGSKPKCILGHQHGW